MWYVIVKQLALPISQGFELKTSAVIHMLGLIEVLEASFPDEKFDDVFDVALF